MAELESGFRAKLFQCYQTKTLCDVVLIAEDDGTRVEAHRLMLFVATEFFNILLTIPMKERNMYEIRLSEIDGETLRSLVEYCYTGRIDINAQNVNALVGAVVMYRFVDLTPKCAETYAQIMDAKNCLSICATANQYNLKDLHEEATDFVHENFMDVMNCDEFLELKAEELLKWLQSEDVVCDAEDDILNGIANWVQFDVGSRRELYKELIANVNLQNLRQNAMAEHFLNFNKQMDLMADFMSAYELQTKGEQQSNINRKSSSQDVLFAIGGAVGTENFSIERFCPKSNSWSVTETSLINRDFFAVGSLNNTHIYVIGGLLNGLAINEVVCISLETMEFTQMTPMTYGRFQLAAVDIDDYIYAIGGGSGADTLNIVERFDAKLNKWITVAPMFEIRRSSAAAVLSEKIYISGGCRPCTEGKCVYLDSTECYNPKANAWTRLGALNAKRATHGCCVVNGFLYAIGGYNGRVRLDSIERFDEKINKWTTIETCLEIPRSIAGITARGNWVYIAGGRITQGAVGVDIDKLDKINLVTGARRKLTSMHHVRVFLHLCSGRQFTTVPAN